MTYFRTKYQGEQRTINGTTGAANAGGVKMPNSGTSVIGNTTTEVFVLEPPITGCKKRIVLNTPSTGVLPVIRCASAASVGISFVGATTGINILTLTTARVATNPAVIDLEGLNSTSWVITNVFTATSLQTCIALTSG
jgi:hypothetical protein